MQARNRSDRCVSQVLASALDAEVCGSDLVSSARRSTRRTKQVASSLVVSMSVCRPWEGPRGVQAVASQCLRACTRAASPARRLARSRSVGRSKWREHKEAGARCCKASSDPGHIIDSNWKLCTPSAVVACCPESSRPAPRELLQRFGETIVLSPASHGCTLNSILTSLELPKAPEWGFRACRLCGDSGNTEVRLRSICRSMRYKHH